MYCYHQNLFLQINQERRKEDHHPVGVHQILNKPNSHIGTKQVILRVFFMSSVYTYNKASQGMHRPILIPYTKSLHHCLLIMQQYFVRV